MERIVVDSNIIAASFLERDTFHQQGQDYINALERGDYIFDLPMLVVVEVMSAISRQALRRRMTLLLTWSQNMIDWERDGRIVLYPLDRSRMERAATIAQRNRLRGADSVIAALADELAMSLRTFDNDILQKFQQASV
jgi:predicted nucleic acid-binding protein